MEVRRFRKELHEAIDHAWRQPVKFAAVSADPKTDINGHYIREGDFESAELDIEYRGNNRVRVRGFALWGKTREFGPNIGGLDFEGELQHGKIAFVDAVGNKVYRLELNFQEDRLIAREDYVIAYFGMNVSFEGVYLKVR